MTKEQFLLIDSHALVHRAYHAFPPLTTSKKELVNAVYGFSVMLLGAIKKFGPEYIVCAFDEKGPTLRTEKFVGYKAQRPEMDKELAGQIGRVREVVDALNIPSFSKQGYEADDVIGTIVQQYLDEKFGRNNLELIVVTGDKDLLQLLGKDVHVALPGRGFADAKLWKVSDFEDEYRFSPDKFVDFKGLKGDPSDNIPGVKGIGDKSATELIKKFGSIDNIYALLDKVPEKHRKKIEGHSDIARLSKDLATIIRDVPVELKLEECKVSAYDRDKAIGLFRELEFSSLIKTLPEADTPGGIVGNGRAGGVGQKKEVGKGVKSVPNLDYTVVRNQNGLKNMLEVLKKTTEIVITAVVDSLDFLNANMAGFSLLYGNKCWYVVVRDKGEQGKFVDLGKKRYGKLLDKLVRRIEDPELRKIGHNLKFDKHIFENEGIKMQGLWFDTMVAGYLLNLGNQNLGLKTMAFNKLGIEMSAFEDVFTGKPDLYAENVDRLAKYCCADSVVAGILREKIGSELARTEKEFAFPGGVKIATATKNKEWSLFRNVEMPMVEILQKMERHGIVVNRSELEKLVDKFTLAIDKTKKKIYNVVGHEFNPGSSPQVAGVLFEELKLPMRRKIKTGFTTGDAVLRKMVNMHPVVPLIREYRELTKLKSTYVNGLLKLLAEKKAGDESQRIYTSFNQTVTTTGRLSSSRPNLQNIPIKTEVGNEIRRCFEADKGYALVSLDYSQIELRVMAHISDDSEMKTIFKEGKDIHNATASILFDTPIEKVTKAQRGTGKTVNFAVMYGMTGFGLSDLLGITQGEARAHIGKFFGRFPHIREYFDGVTEQMKKKGYVETLFGRRRYFAYQEGYHRTQAIIREANNAPLQGSAADIMKIAMIEVDRWLSTLPFDARMVLQVHDELVFEVELANGEKNFGRKKSARSAKRLPLKKLYSDKNLKIFVPEAIKLMETAVKLSVPIDVDAEIGYNWADRIEVEKDKTEE